MKLNLSANVAKMTLVPVGVCVVKRLQVLMSFVMTVERISVMILIRNFKRRM